MILAGQWEPTPPRPGSLDDANARGFDPDSVRHDRATPEPLDDVWQMALDGAIAARKAMSHDCMSGYDSSCSDCTEHDETCGTRCDTCTERMCSFYGPEPRACGTTCGDCPCSCTSCLQVREEMRADLLHQIERESR